MRCIGEKNFFMERVVFPTETISITARLGADVELWGNGVHYEERMVVDHPQSYWESYSSFDN